MDWEEKKAKMDKIMNREDTDHNTDHDQSSHDEEIQNDKILKVNDMLHTKAEENTEIKLRYREDGCPIKPKHVRHPYAYLIRSLLVGIIMILSVISGSVIMPFVTGQQNQQQESVEASSFSSLKVTFKSAVSGYLFLYREEATFDAYNDYFYTSYRPNATSGTTGLTKISSGYDQESSGSQSGGTPGSFSPSSGRYVSSGTSYSFTISYTFSTYSDEYGYSSWYLYFASSHSRASSLTTNGQLTSTSYGSYKFFRISISSSSVSLSLTTKATVQHYDVKDSAGQKRDVDITFGTQKCMGDSSPSKYTLTNLTSFTMPIILSYKSSATITGVPYLVIYRNNSRITTLAINSYSVGQTMYNLSFSPGDTISTYSYVSNTISVELRNDSNSSTHSQGLGTCVSVVTLNGQSYTLNSGEEKTISLPSVSCTVVNGSYNVVTTYSITWTIRSTTINTLYKGGYSYDKNGSFVGGDFLGTRNNAGQLFAYTSIAYKFGDEYMFWVETYVEREIVINFTENTASGTDWYLEYKIYSADPSSWPPTTQFITSGVLENSGQVKFTYRFKNVSGNQYQYSYLYVTCVVYRKSGSGYSSSSGNTSESTNLIMPANTTASTTIDFTITTHYAVTVTNNAGVNITACGSSLSSGTTKTYYREWNTAYSISGSRTGYTLHGLGNFNVGTGNKSHTITATANTYTLTLLRQNGISDLAINGGGDWNYSNGKRITFNYGTSVTIRATVATGFTWSGWTPFGQLLLQDLLGLGGLPVEQLLGDLIPVLLNILLPYQRVMLL